MTQPKPGTNDSFENMLPHKAQCASCGSFDLQFDGKATSIDMTPTLNVGETVRIGNHKYKIIEGGKLERRSHDPLAELKRVE